MVESSSVSLGGGAIDVAGAWCVGLVVEAACAAAAAPSGLLSVIFSDDMENRQENLHCRATEALAMQG